MLSVYYTVKKEASEHEINIQKSRFIAHIKRAETEAEAQEFIQTLKKNIGMPPIIVLLISLVNMIKYKKPMMTVNPAELQVYPFLRC